MAFITLAVLKQLKEAAADLQDDCHTLIGDETIDRAMKQVVKRLTKYIEVASARKQQAITTDEVEAHGTEE